jgi:hypothetical protein
VLVAPATLSAAIAVPRTAQSPWTWGHQRQNRQVTRSGAGRADRSRRVLCPSLQEWPCFTTAVGLGEFDRIVDLPRTGTNI